MNEVVQTAFRRTVKFLPSELKIMPLSRWNESVLRYFFCRFLAKADPEVEQFVECDHIDLVLKSSRLVAFVEFKFFIHPRRFDPYDGTARGFKGGPGRQNLREFRACIDRLHKRPPTPGLSKYVVLVYADPADGSRPGGRYSHYYDQYRHPRTDVVRRVKRSGPIDTTECMLVRAQLYKVG